MRRLLLLTTAAVLLAGCSTGSSGDEERDARVGEVFPSVGAVDGRPTTFVFPASTYQFVVSSPRERTESPAALLDDDVSAKAGDGRAFVDVSYDLQSMDGDVWPLSPEHTEVPRFWLEYDGTKVELDTSENRSWIVAVPEDPEVRLLAEFDGRELAVEPYDQLFPSAGGDVYDGQLPRMTSHHCPAARRAEVAGGVDFMGTRCRVEVLDPVPWFQPAGWAPTDKEYVLARISIDINTSFAQTVNGEYFSRKTEYGEPRYTLGGVAPTAMFNWDREEITSRPDDMDIRDARWVLFEVPAEAREAKLKFRLTYTGVPEIADTDAATARYTFKRSIDLNFG